MVAGSILGVVAVGAVSYAYFQYPYLFRGNSMAKYVQEYQQVRDEALDGEYDTAIEALTDLVYSAPNKAFEGKAKILLGSNYLRRGQPGDEAKGMSLYKDVVSDYTIPAQVRALALDTIAWVVRRNTTSFYQLYFPEEPYATYLPATGDESSKLRSVYIKLLQLADQTYPNSYAKYAIAGDYYAPLIVNGFVSGDADLADTARLMQQYVAQGDALKDEDLYSPNFLLGEYYHRALALTASGRILGEPSLEVREEAYERILTKAEGLALEPGTSAYLTLMKSRFYYANFLLRDVGGRDGDIKKILEPFADATFDPNTTPPYSTAYAHERARALSAVSTELKDYLTRYNYLK